MFLAGEGRAQGRRGPGFSGFGRTIYRTRLFGVGMRRRMQIGGNPRGGRREGESQSQRAAASWGKEEMQQRDEGWRQEKGKEGEEQKGKGRKGRRRKRT